MKSVTSQTLTLRMAAPVRHPKPAYPITNRIPRSAGRACSTRVTARGDRHRESDERRAPAQRYEPPTPDNFWVAESAPPQFVIACKQCGRQLMTVVRITDREIPQLEAHIRACVRPDPLGETPALGVVMAQIRVTARGA